jgi:hypothetical protein
VTTAPVAAERLPAMPPIEHPAFGFLRWPADRADRSWQPVPCKSITLESGSNWPAFTIRKVTLFRDGRALAHNSYEEFAREQLPEHVPGHYESSFPWTRWYGTLCYLIERADFWRLDSLDTAPISDCPWAILTVEGEDTTHSVRDNCERAPVDIVALKHVFHDMVSRLAWKRIADASGAPLPAESAP